MKTLSVRQLIGTDLFPKYLIARSESKSTDLQLKEKQEGEERLRGRGRWGRWREQTFDWRGINWEEEGVFYYRKWDVVSVLTIWETPDMHFWEIN